MKTRPYKLLDKLSKPFQEKVKKWFSEVNKDSEVIFVTETWRSEERQKELVRLWLSKVARSNHQDGRAVDIWFRGKELYPTNDKLWRRVADIAKKYGIDWWFDLWKWDKPHFQDNWIPLMTTIQNQSKYSDIFTQELKNANLEPIFSSHEGDKPLTERETKELIEIAFIRFIKRK